ncbi:YaaC family protein [Photobacterium halotolerans]|uniref:YaaC family protein n=1 Tax=Photobacterium halotolerans TaxID=265726 RepID=UPI00040A766F|nr:YaaC family protein [Photobacterium halotolerans]
MADIVGRIQRVSDRVTDNAQEIREIKCRLKPAKSREPLKVGIWPVSAYHALIEPIIKSKTILTDSTWEFVEIFLKQNSNGSARHKNAIFYWQQARNFHKATKSLDNNSKPLTTYYCFLNATKALLEIKNIAYDFSHGVSGRSENGHNNIKNEYVRLKTKGVLAGLCTYLEEAVQPISEDEPHEEYSRKDVFYNLAYIHRSYNVTYKNQTELFIPILNPMIVKDKIKNKAWAQFELEPEHSTQASLTKLRSLKYELEVISDNSTSYTIRHKRRFKWNVKRNNPDLGNINRLNNYLKARRKELQYIYSANELWYIKRNDLQSSSVIDRNPLVLTYAAMHRLSELARYQPNILQSHLEKDASWLLNEFIDKSIVQFLDQVSSEITGNQFRITGFRS